MVVQNFDTPARQGGDWRATLPEDWTVVVTDPEGREVEIPLREHPALAKYASKDEAVKALVHAQRLIGRRPEGAVEVPGQGDGPERWGSFWAALGRPDDPSGYELPELDLPEGFEVSDDMRQGFLGRAFELGLTPDQVRGLYEWFLPLNVEAAQRLEGESVQRRAGELESLRLVWRGGTAGVLDSARRAAVALGGDELLAALEETGAGDRAAVITALARVAPMLLEGRLRNGTPAGAEPLSKARLREMMRDPRYLDPSRRDPEFVRQVQRGFETLYPGEYQAQARG
ncbi:MAG: hypothetical protein AB7D57_11305 [Desulfovibrionaceae bacterium]